MSTNFISLKNRIKLFTVLITVLIGVLFCFFQFNLLKTEIDNDHKKNIKAKIIIAYDETSKITTYKNVVYLTFLFIFISLLVFLIVIEIVFRKFIKKIEEDEAKLNGLNKKLEKVVEENSLKEELIQEQSKMATMGEMINNITHQWKQPLNFISVHISNLNLQSQLSEITKNDISNMTNEIMKNIRFMAQTIDDFKNFFKVDKSKTEFFISNVLNKDLKFLDSTFKTHDIIVHSDIIDCSIIGFRNEFAHALLNIFNNAKDALIENIDEPKLIFINTIKKENELIIEIKDNAGGIPENIIDKVFNRHYTTKAPEKGTGIGLYMTKSIIEKVKGSIEVTNETYIFEEEEFTGAKFTITLDLKSKFS